ncbi:MAG: hypothetical protein HY509_03380 [Acidobacteria bacterium]|nr:hypothetical protein [Acidobacteriota bacterium]
MDPETLQRLYDYPVFPCPRCGNRALALRERHPRATFQCFECEAVFHASGPYPRAAASGPLRLESGRGRGEAGFAVDLAEGIPASRLFPEEFTEGRLRLRHRRERFLQTGCTLVLLLIGLALAGLLLRFLVGAL